MLKQDKKLSKQLNIIRGQLEGVAKMIEAKRDCPDILIQLKAAKNGINRISTIYAKTYLAKCLAGKKTLTSKELEAIFRDT